MTMSISADVDEVKKIMNNVIEMVNDGEARLDSKLCNMSEMLDVNKEITDKRIEEESEKLTTLIE